MKYLSSLLFLDDEENVVYVYLCNSSVSFNKKMKICKRTYKVEFTKDEIYLIDDIIIYKNAGFSKTKINPLYVNKNLIIKQRIKNLWQHL